MEQCVIRGQRNPNLNREARGGRSEELQLRDPKEASEFARNRRTRALHTESGTWHGLQTGAKVAPSEERGLREQEEMGTLYPILQPEASKGFKQESARVFIFKMLL